MASKFSSIFDPEDESAPKARKTYTDDTAGIFSAGRQVKDEKGNARGESLDKWRVAVADMAVAEALVQLYGGNIEENTESGAEKFIDVYLATASVQGIISGEDAIEQDYKQFVNNKLTHHCDGRTFKSHPRDDDKVGTPCGCPSSFAEKKANAQDELGPKPSIEVTFRLAQDPELGTFKMRTASWSMLRVLPEIGEDMDNISGEVLVNVAIEHVEFTAKQGKMKGKVVSYDFPTLKNPRSYNDAIAD